MYDMIDGSCNLQGDGGDGGTGVPINSFRTEKGGMDIVKILTKSKIIILINLKRNIFLSNYAYYVITTHANKIFNFNFQLVSFVILLFFSASILCKAFFFKL